MTKVLHITNWYPNKWNDVEALFVREQFALFSEVTETRLLHVEVRQSSEWFKYEKVRYSDNETGYYILTKIKTFRIIEILTTLLLLFALFRNRCYKYDLLHFHIAYPLLTYHFLWKAFVKIPVIVSEHWSAYHFNFYMPPETHKLERIKNIFRRGLPVITVSKALLEDIRRFAGTQDFPSYVIPNVIDLDSYTRQPGVRTKTKPVFFIVNFWRAIKNPFPMLEGFAFLAMQQVDFELRIGGYGPIMESMKAFVREHGLGANTVFLGKLYKEAIAREMNEADAYLFSSNYETFSAVCAQSLCCGCPLIGPPLSAVMEYTSVNEIVTLEANDARSWADGIREFLENRERFDRGEISGKTRALFSHERIKSRYMEVING